MDPICIKGNIFATKCQTVVNTVNCVGVMGAGLALECRLRYPTMFDEYAQLCGDGMIKIGSLWLFRAPDRWILNFPTKNHWKYPTKESYIQAGLEAFLSTYVAEGITSIAFPLLGAQNGGLSPKRSLELMLDYLSRCSIPVEVYEYDPRAPDDLYLEVKRLLQTTSHDRIKAITGLREDIVNRLQSAAADPAIVQINQLARVDGIGDKTLEKLFRLRATGSVATTTGQGSLDL